MFPNCADRDRIRRSPNSSPLSPFTTEITFGEIRFGIVQLDDPARRADIRSWLDRTLRPLFAGRVLSITEDVIVRWKAMVTEGQRRGHTFGQPDLFIAAIAALENLAVVTRDISEFVAADVPAFDPWSSTLHAHGRQVDIRPPATIEAVADAALGESRAR